MRCGLWRCWHSRGTAIPKPLTTPSKRVETRTVPNAWLWRRLLCLCSPELLKQQPIATAVAAVVVIIIAAITCVTSILLFGALQYAQLSYDVHDRREHAKREHAERGRGRIANTQGTRRGSSALLAIA